MSPHPPPPRPLPRRRRFLPVAAILGAAAVTASCACNRPDRPPPAGGVVRQPPAPTTTTTDPPPTTNPLTPEAKVKAAYLEADRVYYEVLAHPDPADPRLSETRSGRNLLGVQQVMIDYRRQGFVARYPGDRLPVSTVLKIAMKDTSAVLATCIVDDSVKTRTAGEVVIDDDVVTSQEAVVMRFARGRWRVESQSPTLSWPDGKGCDR